MPGSHGVVTLHPMRAVYVPSPPPPLSPPPSRKVASGRGNWIRLTLLRELLCSCGEKIKIPLFYTPSSHQKILYFKKGRERANCNYFSLPFFRTVHLSPISWLLSLSLFSHFSPLPPLESRDLLPPPLLFLPRLSLAPPPIQRKSPLSLSLSSAFYSNRLVAAFGRVRRIG